MGNYRLMKHVIRLHTSNAQGYKAVKNTSVACMVMCTPDASMPVSNSSTQPP